MKTTAFIFLFAFLNSFSWSQKELVNSYSYYSEVYGGMEDGGVSRTESFAFIAKATVEIKNIFYNNEKIILQKGDSLIVNVAKFITYNPEQIDTSLNTNSSEEKEVKPEDRFRVVKFGRIIYLNVQANYLWPGTIEYIYKKKPYTSMIKKGFDEGFTSYAP